MGWRYVAYMEGELIALRIEPMATGPDSVYVPSPQRWRQVAPAWAQDRSNEIIARLKSIPWQRDLQWIESPDTSLLTDTAPVTGALESTPGGQQLESERLFHPGSFCNHNEAHQVWHIAARKFAQAASGRVTIYGHKIIHHSVFEQVELPALRANPSVTLDWVEEGA
jgi:hypothetical protein